MDLKIYSENLLLICILTESLYFVSMNMHDDKALYITVAG